MPENILYAQSGGVTAVINVSAQAAIETARQYPDRIGTVLAARNGIVGALAEDLIDTSAESAESIASLGHTPGGAFGSCRYKLKGIDEHRAEYERLIDVCRAHDIGTFLYNGGGDSADTCLKISQIGKLLGYPLKAIHVPKTMDNDLPLTDCCPGFGSVAKYTATSIREAAIDLVSMASTSTQVFIMEVMGRHAGWTAAAGGLAAEREGDAPQIILFPEIDFDETKFLEKVESVVKECGHCAIVASEGLRWSDGTFVSELGTRDAFGHAQLGGLAPQLAQLLKSRLGLKCHYAVADYLMRSARHIASAVDIEQAYAVGKLAVEKSLEGVSGVMISIERQSDDPYRWTTGTVPLSKVANQERTVPRRFIRQDGFHLTAAGRAYLQPLIQGERFPPFRNGLPVHARLTNERVTRKLPLFDQQA